MVLWSIAAEEQMPQVLREIRIDVYRISKNIELSICTQLNKEVHSQEMQDLFSFWLDALSLQLMGKEIIRFWEKTAIFGQLNDARGTKYILGFAAAQKFSYYSCYLPSSESKNALKLLTQSYIDNKLTIKGLEKTCSDLMTLYNLDYLREIKTYPQFDDLGNPVKKMAEEKTFNVKMVTSPPE
jgi:hypothetical protein